MDVVWLATVAAYPIFVLVVDMAIRVLAVIYIPRNRRPQTALAWLVLIFALPVPGIVLFLLFGSRRLPDVARGMGQSMRIFKNEIKTGKDEDAAAAPAPTTAAPAATAPVAEPVVKSTESDTPPAKP